MFAENGFRIGRKAHYFVYHTVTQCENLCKSILWEYETFLLAKNPLQFLPMASTIQDINVFKARKTVICEKVNSSVGNKSHLSQSCKTLWSTEPASPLSKRQLSLQHVTEISENLSQSFCTALASGIGRWHKPRMHCNWGIPDLYFDYPITKGWCQPTGGHVL